MNRSLLLGVDAGSANVAVALADVTGGEPQVIGAGLAPCSGVRRGAVVDLNATAQAIREAVRQAGEMAGQPESIRAVVAISGTHIRSVVGSAEVEVHRPSVGVTAEDIRAALDAAAAVALPPEREVIHVLPRSYRLDGSEGVMDPIGLAGRRLVAEAHLITGERLPLQNYLGAAGRAGLEVADYQVGLRVSGDAVLTRHERESGVLLLDIGAGTTGIAVYDRGHLWHVAVIPVGGEHITGDIATLLQVPIGVAEQLKIERGWASANLCPEENLELVTPSGQQVREVEAKKLADIIESRVQEILQLAAAQVKRSGYTGLFPGGLVLTGGGAKLQGLVGVAADCLGLPARLGVPEGPLVGSPEFATAVGLVKWGARLAQDEVAAAAAAVARDKWGRIKDWLFRLIR